MKKFQAVFLLVIVFSIFSPVFAENNFSKALRNCGKYTKNGVIPYKNQNFNVSISLEKNLKGACIYKEKVYQSSGFELLTCNFNKNQLPIIADSMERYNQYYKNQIAQNDIFEAKMTTNGEVFGEYLANPAICNITYKKF